MWIVKVFNYDFQFETPGKAMAALRSVLSDPENFFEQEDLPEPPQGYRFTISVRYEKPKEKESPWVNLRMIKIIDNFVRRKKA